MGNFFQELKRRNVYKTATLYVVSCWVILQVASTTFPIFGISDNSLRIPTIVLIAGFPAILILSWIYDFSSQGITKTNSDSEPAKATSLGTDVIVILLLLVIVGFTVVERFVIPIENEPALSRSEAASTGNVTRSVLPLGLMDRARNGDRINFAISPDGSRLGYFAFSAGNNIWRIYTRDLDSLESRLLDEASIFAMPNPTFSPDGEWLAFYGAARLNKVSLNSGAILTVSDSGAHVNGGFGTFWASDESIYFLNNENSISKVSSAGGLASKVGVLGSEEQGLIIYPVLLPDNKTLLTTYRSTGPDDIRLVDTETNNVRSLNLEGEQARYTSTGHLVFLRSAELWVAPFDLESLQLSGRAVQALPGMPVRDFDFSNNGRLIYLPETQSGQSTSLESSLTIPTWVDRRGNESPLELAARQFRSPAISPDETALAFHVGGQEPSTVWTYDFAQGILNRGPLIGASRPIWTQDSQRIVYITGSTNSDLVMSRKDFSDEPVRLTNSTIIGMPNSFTPDGSTLLYSLLTNSFDQYILSMNNEFQPRLLIDHDTSVFFADLSPNGRWIAYASGETGRLEVYVSPFPDISGGTWQISEGGGNDPQWSNDGEELFFRQPVEGQLAILSSSVNIEADFSWQPPEIVFRGNYFHIGSERAYAASNDGERILMLKPVSEYLDDGDEQEVSLVMVDNWFEELKHLAPTEE